MDKRQKRCLVFRVILFWVVMAAVVSFGLADPEVEVEPTVNTTTTT